MWFDRAAEKTRAPARFPSPAPGPRPLAPFFSFVLLLLNAQLSAQEPATPPALSGILSRVAEEAEVFQQNSPKALTLETLEQRTLMPPPRFRPRIGKAAVTTQAPKPRLQVREI